MPKKMILNERRKRWPFCNFGILNDKIHCNTQHKYNSKHWLIYQPLWDSQVKSEENFRFLVFLAMTSTQIFRYQLFEIMSWPIAPKKNREIHKKFYVETWKSLTDPSMFCLNFFCKVFNWSKSIFENSNQHFEISKRTSLSCFIHSNKISRPLTPLNENEILKLNFSWDFIFGTKLASLHLNHFDGLSSCLCHHRIRFVLVFVYIDRVLCGVQ